MSFTRLLLASQIFQNHRSKNHGSQKKMKLNKACDLSSISVFPPQSRKPNVRSGPQTSQLRSQPSQQSFSQGLSSQHGMFSQLSQSSFDEFATVDQRIGSQERENSIKKVSCSNLANYTREESQVPRARSPTDLMRKWNPASAQDRRSQISEELEHRIGMMETSFSRFAMILDSVQSDVMQVNKGVKEVLLEMESIRQKLSIHDNSLQLMNKVQEDMKAGLDGRLKSLSDQISTEINQDKLQHILELVSAFPQHIEGFQLKLQTELCCFFNKEMEAVACSLKNAAITSLPSKDAVSCIIPTKKPRSLKSEAVVQKVCSVENQAPITEMTGWKSVKPGRAAIREEAPWNQHKRESSLIKQEREYRVIIDSDEDVDGGFLCLLDEKKTDNIEDYLNEEKAKQETKRILRRARRQRRKYSNPIIIN